METYVIHVTKECNCNCLYCYEKDKTSKYTWDEIKTFIDNLVKYATEKKFTIEFLGGEPMLAWDLIKKTYEYFEKEKKEVEVNAFVITTNGTVLDDKKAEFIANHKKIHFAVSMDGHKYANQLRYFKDSNVNTYDKVMENISLLKKHGGEASIHIVSHPYNVAFLSESIFHLYNKGIKNIDVGSVESTMEIDERYCERFIKELDYVSKKIVDGTFPDLSIGLFNWLKPPEDVRSYIRDESGKVVGESYGRVGEDITHKDVYKTQRCIKKPKSTEMIVSIRKKVYDNHQKRLASKNEN